MPKWWHCAGGGGSPREITQSQYSLVPCDDLTPRSLQLWLSLPDEIRNDPALEPFRQLYEREHAPVTKRLPSVKSAPDLKPDCLLSEPDGEPKDNVYAKQEPNTSELSGDKNGKSYDITEKLLPRPISKLAAVSSYVKITTLLACWSFFTVVFLMYSEKTDVVKNTAVAPGEVKSYNLNVSDEQLSILVKLSGPFLTEQAESKMNWSSRRVAPHIRVWLERHAINGTLNHLDVENVKASKLSEPWLITLMDGDLDFYTGTLRSTTLRLGVDASKSSETTGDTTYFLRTQSNASQLVPFALSYTLRPLEPSTGLVYSVLLLCALYGAIIFEIINRTMAAVLVSTTSLAALALVGERPSLPELMSWLDVETLMLLFSMMILVAIMAETGIFDFLAVYAFEATRGKIWALINLLNAITALASTFLDNVTTVLLMTPVTIRLCEVTSLDPVPILMAMVFYTNIGGAATPVGDPPNVIIATNRAVTQAGIHFTNFTIHMTLGCLLVCVQTYLQLRYWHIDIHKLRNGEPKDIQELRRQITIWARAADSLPQVSRDEQVVYERLQCKVRKLSDKLCAMQLETKARACSKDTFHTTLAQLKAKYKIRDKVLLVKASVATLFVIIVFFLHSIPEFKRISLAWTALLGALLLLVLADREDLESILHRVEWSTLIFFAALFVLMEALSKLGLIDFIGGLTESLILNVHESGRLAVALLLMLWVCGIASAFIDNIPLTTMMVRVVTSLGSNPHLGLPMAPLVWALSFGACLGGNGTLIGASANVLCAGVASQHGYRISFVQFFKIGFPVMIGHLVVASAYLLLCHCVFTWH